MSFTPEAVKSQVDKPGRVSAQLALDLWSGAGTAELMARADQVRQDLHGKKTYFVHSLNLNPTNICRNCCRLCAFWRSPGDADVYVVDLDKAKELFISAKPWNLSDLHIVGGLIPELNLDYYEKLFRLAKQILPSVLIQGLTAVEIHWLGQLEDISVQEVLGRLRAAGLGAIPGGGAEIFAPRVRRQICSEKISAHQWLHVHETAHLMGIPSNATMLFGHIETAEEIIEHLLRLRELQDRTGGFRAFCPLPFHPKGTDLDVESSPGGFTIARVVALSRIVLDNFAHIRALANFLDRKLLEVLLHGGADDIGGTSIDERIVRSAGAKESVGFADPAQIEAFIRAVDLEPVFTNSLYESAQKQSSFQGVSTQGQSEVEVKAALARAAKGERLGTQDAVLLHDQAEFYELGRAALQRRKQVVPGGLGTFIVDRNITFTNVCVAGCRFCAFHTKPGCENGFVMPIEEIVRKVEQAAELGATQIMLQGGLNPNLDLAFYEQMLKRIKSRVDIWLHSLSPTEVLWLANSSGLTIEQVLQRLRAAGLDSLPGGGAEILVDQVRQKVSPAKLSAEEWLEVVGIAQELGMGTTATMVYGLGESSAQRIEHLLRIRSLQDRTGGFRAFIPWSFQSSNTRWPLPRQTGVDYLRMVALARLVLDNIAHIQAGWVTEGAEMAQLALDFGADDFGGVLMEESVVRAAGTHNSITAQRIIDLIAEAGWVPAQRDTQYEIVRCFDCSAAFVGN